MLEQLTGQLDSKHTPHPGLPLSLKPTCVRCVMRANLRRASLAVAVEMAAAFES